MITIKGLLGVALVLLLYIAIVDVSRLIKIFVTWLKNKLKK